MENKTLCAMSANIRFTNPNDGDHDWPNRREYVAELIHREAPHLLGTQEGREPQLRELEKLLPSYHMVDGHRDWITERMYPCIYILKERFDVIASGDIWLSETPDIAGSKSFNSAFPRLVTYAHLFDKALQKNITYANCHLDHVEEDTRINQAKVLSRELTKILKDNCPLILCGDFNTSPKGPVRKIFEQEIRDLIDPWFEKSLPEESSFHKFDGLDPDGSQTRIDWILHQRPLKEKEIYLIKDHKDGLYPSDHFFVVSRLEYL